MSRKGECSMDRDYGVCWLCGRNGSRDPLDKHHVFGGSLRSKSEKYGLTVYLCHDRCHIFGKDAVHRNPAVRQELQAWGQRKAMREQGWSVEEFIWAFGKNCLDLIEEEDEPAGGFMVLDDELPDLAWA